jgi:ABC-type polysaccharide/polyol phosphate transport system ATPase subunit
MTSIKLRNVRVEYPIYSARGRSLKTLILQRVGGEVVARDDRILVTALEDVSVTINAGERVALLGGNGAGKSTLLRVAAGILEPTSGYAEVNGQVATLIDMSTGMDLEATGYENITTRAIFLGMTYAEAKALADEVAEFSELGEFLELPIRTYSTGMLMRLSFAVSTAVNPEILVLDEHLGAGDVAFAGKMKDRIGKLIDRARILIFATHDMAVAQNLCSRGIVMKAGRIIHDGEIGESVTAYLDMMTRA